MSSPPLPPTGRASAPWSPRLIDALCAWGTDETSHSGRALLDHLVGTADRLRAWRNPEPVCLAGLFHSVYGTQSFTIQSVPMERRDQIVALIGEEAEALAWLFCVCRRRGLWGAPPGEALVLQQHATGEAIPVSARQAGQLLEIEVANLLDQLPPRARGGPEREAYMRTFHAGIQGWVSSGAMGALEAWLEAP